MAGLLRIEVSGGLYHLTDRGNEQKAIYRGPTGGRSTYLTMRE